MFMALNDGKDGNRSREEGAIEKKKETRTMAWIRFFFFIVIHY
jgi:hypothetical protein